MLSHCSGGKSAQTGAPGETPGESPGGPPGVEGPLGITAVGDEPGDYLAIHKSALGGEFLLQASFSEQQSYGGHVSNPTSSGLKSRIVVFQEYGEELLMLDAGGEFHPGDELTSHILITSFPVKEQDGDTIVFNFNKGMSNFVAAWDWYGSDFSGQVLYPDMVLSVKDSYIRGVDASSEAITVKQTMSVGYGLYLLPMELTYYITRYRENSNFVPVISPGFDYVGFFEANPLVQDDFGIPYNYISRWDVSGPITYYLSQDVPEEYRDSICQGVLYWNKIFGSDVLKCEIAPEGITAPDFKHNIIQWHTDHFTGAYADAQLDPRTGEILHSQVFLSSGLVAAQHSITGRIDRKLQDYKKFFKDKISEDPEEPSADDQTYLSAKEFKESRWCELSLTDVFNKFYLHRDAMQDLAPGRLESITQDLLTWLAAHEVGHTMGLRHNFAASSVNEWSGAEEEEIFKSYMREGVLPDGITAPHNSVMEYPNLYTDVIAGALIKKGQVSGFSYDHYAIQWAYFGDGSDPVYQGNPYCPDSQIGRYADCEPYDSGRHLVERRAFEARRSLETVPHLLAEIYLDAKASINPMWRQSVTGSTPPAWYLAGSVVWPWSRVLTLFTEEIRLVDFYRQYPDLIDADRGAIDERMLTWLDSEISEAGGIEEVLKLINPAYFRATAENFATQFEQLINSDAYQNVPLFEGGSAGFTSDEISFMRMRAGDIFPAVEDELAYAISLVLQIGRFKLIDEIEKVEEALTQWGGFIITSGSGLDFRYSFGTRVTALSLLVSGGPLPDWMSVYIPAIAGRLRENLEAGFGRPLEEIDIRSYPREDQQHLSDELAIYYILASRGVGSNFNGPAEEPGAEEPADEGGGEELGGEGAVSWLQKLL